MRLFKCVVCGKETSDTFTIERVSPQGNVLKRTFGCAICAECSKDAKKISVAFGALERGEDNGN